MNILKYFKIEECALWISENKFKKVALQFPEILFCYVTEVVRQLKLRMPFLNIVVLADAKYGSCCVDEIACEHAQVSGVIHFGHACLSQISRQNLKVKYVFGDEHFDENVFDSFLCKRLSENEKVILFVDVVYFHVLAKIKAFASKYCTNILCPEIVPPNNTSISTESTEETSRNSSNIFINCSNKNIIDSNTINVNPIQTINSIDNDFNFKCSENNKLLLNDKKLNNYKNYKEDCLDIKNNYLLEQCIDHKCETLHEDKVTYDSIVDTNLSTDSFIKFGRLFKFNPLTKFSDYTILYIGAENQFLTVFMMTFSACKFLVFDPKNQNLENISSNVNKMLMKRYYLVEKAKDSKFIGILIGTLNVSYYSNIVNKLKQVIKRAGKKCRIYAPGTPNVAKLANVSEFDMFVAVACPENSLIDCSDYLQPIVTPFEMILACQVDFNWSGKYEVDFSRICQLADKDLKSISNKNRTDVSLVSGKIINFENEALNYKDSSNRQLVVQNQSLVLSESYLSDRTFQGLNPQLGETSVKKFITGATGIATGYTNEPNIN